MHLGIDLGTCSILIYVKKRGVVLREPSVVAVDKQTQKIVAVGEQALHLAARSGTNLTLIRPLREGTVSDYAMAEALLRHSIGKVMGRGRLLRPQCMICVPTEITSVEKRAVVETTLAAGAGRAYLLEKPMAAAIGAGLNIEEKAGHCLVDIGGGTTDAAVISEGGIVVSQSLRVAGVRMDEAIVRHMRKNHNLMIGERTAEAVKISIGSAWPDDGEASTEIRGRDLIDGRPKTMGITAAEVRQALHEPLVAIVEAVQKMLERTPPALAMDIKQRGITLTGGGALLAGLDVLLADCTGYPCRVAKDPVSCVAIGAGEAESLKL